MGLGVFFREKKHTFKLPVSFLTKLLGGATIFAEISKNLKKSKSRQ